MGDNMMFKGAYDVLLAKQAEVAAEKAYVSGVPNTLPMMTGTGPFGPIEMGGMFTVVNGHGR